LSLIEGIDSIDATGIYVAPWSVPEPHSYYASKLRVVEDLVGVIRGLGPAARVDAPGPPGDPVLGACVREVTYARPA